jgi:hypothetical protein
MKKIAIQTLRLTNNYGGILQAFALQFYLENLGFETTHINRFNRPSSITLKVKITLYKLYYHSFYSAERLVNLKYASFINKYINLSEKLFSLKEWQNYIQKNKFDLVFVGSDQVWRLEYIKDLYPEFFLDFKSTDIKKASYAASFGVNNFDDYPLDEIKSLVSDFSGISIREDSGKLFLNKIVGQEVHHHIDPTLLLSAKEYTQKFNLDDKKKRDEIFCYVLDKSEAKQRIINDVKDQLNLNVNFVYGAGVTLNNYKDSDILSKPSIEDWLQNFLCAEFIITDSFHGMVFSIIFNKPFMVIANEERGVSRFTSLLSILGLEERLVFLNEDWNVAILNKDIDFTQINSIVNDERERSKKYILNLLK